MSKKFTKGTRRTALEYEKDIVGYWKENKTFEKSVEQRDPGNSYVFYDGPPFLTGLPHQGHLLSSIIKDAIPRYWTMKGKRVERVWGWDCHGLPAEVYTEKQLGIEDKRDIGTKVSLEEYINTCRATMVKTGTEWEDTIDRIGRWVEFKGAYMTMHKEYMESVWWAFKTLYEKGKIYEGEKVLMYCPRDATPISKAEVAMDNSYTDDTDPTAYAKFKIVDDDRYLLAWTTTPWTLLSNSAIAVNQDLEYADVEVNGEVFVLAKDLIEKALTDEKHNVVEHKVLKTYKGSELVGLSYQPLVEDYREELGDNAFKVWHAGFVHADEGTGIAHESPAYGEDDYALARKNKFPWVLNTDENGRFTGGEWRGRQVWEANKEIAKSLKEQDKVWKIEYITHPYPHCYRCDTKLIYRAHPSWFMDIDGQRTEMLATNSEINWTPDHLKHGRFENTVKDAPDWNLSRDRFWATAMPVWKGIDKDGKELVKVVGSYAELKELSGVELEDYHRPWIDDVKFEIDGVEYTRIEKVMDCWFESGSMPFAQFHYPFENVEKFENNFPGSFITEYVGQVRAWFYYVHAVSIGLFGKKAFENVITTGTIAGNDGRKMSKKLGNYTDPNEMIDQYSADALRLLFLSSSLLNGEDFALKDKDVSDVHRKLAMIWNMYDFFTLYAEVDGWEFDGDISDPSDKLEHTLDKWAVSRVHQVQLEVEKHMDAYDVPSATRPLFELIDDMSNWYVRRSRKRFWKSEDDSDKQQAYKTLHYVLTQIAITFAPFTPFLSEELYRNLTGEESVHLLDWPEVGHINELLLSDMGELRIGITEALSQRAKSQLKTRQPLAKVTVTPEQDFQPDHRDEMLEILAEEVNVKEAIFKPAGKREVVLDTDMTPELEREGMMREFVRLVQNHRKQSELNVEDRIKLSVSTSDKEAQKMLDEHSETIKTEVLAEVLDNSTYKHELKTKIGEAELTISIERA